MTDNYCSLASDSDGSTLLLNGMWNLENSRPIWKTLTSLSLAGPLKVDGSSLQNFDTASAMLLRDALVRDQIDPATITWTNAREEHIRVFHNVCRLLSESIVHEERITAAWHQRFFQAIGRYAWAQWEFLIGHLNFLGQTVFAFGQLLRSPGKLRMKEFTVQLEQICLTAMPVVALVTMLIGITVAYLLGLQAEKYGANIFVIDGVGIGMTREFSPIIVATIVAGRSGAAFTAHLGAMRLTEETDAIETLGLSPMQVVVVPRVLALVIALPLLVFLGDVMSILGAVLISEPLLGLTPTTVFSRLQTDLDMLHVWVGLVKAPVFALVIGIIGCRMGMTVTRDTRAVGIATTSTVVQSIVSVILLDAAFAVILQELGW